MNLTPKGTEFVRVSVSGVPADASPMEISFDGANTWHEAEYNSLARTEVRVRVSGPDALDPAAIILPRGRHPVSVRLVDTSETVIRHTGETVDVG